MLDIGLHLMMFFPSNLKDPFFHPIGIPSGSSSFNDTEETILDMHAYLHLQQDSSVFGGKEFIHPFMH